MLNQHDVHHKGARILALGASIANIGESVAIEVSQDVAVRKKQLEANAQLVANSGGALAPCSSQERFLSCSSSHLVAFCRAVAHGCSTQEPYLKEMCNGQLSLPSLAPQSTNMSSDFVTMCEKGWQWTIISQSIEQAFPDLPSFIQQALNTTQAVSQGQGECEVMLSIATHYHNQVNTSAESDLQKAISMAGMSKPDCHQYLPTLGYYVKHYGGGDDFPILHLLQHISILSSCVFHMRQNPNICDMCQDQAMCVSVPATPLPEASSSAPP